MKIEWDFDGFESPADHSIEWSVFYLVAACEHFNSWDRANDATLFTLAAVVGGP